MRRATILSSRQSAPLPSHRAVWLLRCLSSCCRLVLSCPLTAPPSHCLIAQAGCCIESCCAVVSSYRHAVLSSSCRPLTAPPSCCQIVQDSCCLTSHHAAVLSSRHAALSSSCRPLTVPPSCRQIAPSGCCTLVVLLSRPLDVLSLCHSLVVLCRLVAVLPLIVPPYRPLIALPSCPLIARQLVVAWLHQTLSLPLNAPPPPPPLHAIFIVHPRPCHHLCHCHRHLHCRMHHPRALTKKEAVAPPPLVYQWQHHREHIYRSKQIGLI